MISIVIETSVTTQQSVEHLPSISFVGGEENPVAWPRSSEEMACFCLLNQLLGVAFCWFKLTMLAIWESLYNFGCHVSHEKNLGWSFMQRMILLQYWMILIVESSAYFRLLKWESVKLSTWISLRSLRSPFLVACVRPFGLTLAVGYLPSSFVCPLAKSCYWIMLVCDLPEKRKPVVQLHATTLKLSFIIQ